MQWNNIKYCTHSYFYNNLGQFQAKTVYIQWIHLQAGILFIQMVFFFIIVYSYKNCKIVL